MDIGIFSKTFQREDIGKVLGAISRCGYRSAHLSFESAGLESLPNKISDKKIGEIKGAQDSFKVYLTSASGTFNMAHPDPKVIEDGLSRLNVIAEACSKLSIPLISLCSGTLNPKDKWAPHPDNSTKEAWSTMLKTMEKAVKISEKHKVSIGIEPELTNIVSSPKKAYKLISELRSDRAKVILDPANLFELASPEEAKSIIHSALDLLNSSIAMVHAKDRNRAGDFVLPGGGVVPFEWLINELRTRKLNVPLVAHGFEESKAKSVLIYLKSCL